MRKRAGINNIEKLRSSYYRHSALKGITDKRGKPDRKESLYLWRESLSKEQRQELDAMVKTITLLYSGIGELIALEIVFKLTEFVTYVDKNAIIRKKGKD